MLAGAGAEARLETGKELFGELGGGPRIAARRCKHEVPERGFAEPAHESGVAGRVAIGIAVAAIGLRERQRHRLDR